MTLYLDTSALVKLYVEEEGSERISNLVARADTVATSAVAYAECRAALARRRHERTLGTSDVSSIVGQLDADWPRYVTIEVSDALARRAGSLADQFTLRGFDAIHLASFELILERAGDQDEVQFSTDDDRLARAARKLG